MFTARKQDGLVFYDGVCALCNRSIHFLLKRDKRQSLRFAPLQGETAKLRRDLPESLRSVVFVRQPDSPGEQVFDRSEAALRLLDHIGGLWRVVSWLRIIPRALRDKVYDMIARRRYGWFGKFDSCPMPAPEWRDRFLP